MLLFAGLAAFAPTPRMLRPTWCAGALALLVAGYFTGARGVAMGGGEGAAVTVAGAAAIALSFWLLRPGPEAPPPIHVPKVDWKEFEQAAYEDYLRSDVRA